MLYSLKMIYSLILANFIQVIAIVGLVIYIFRKRKQTYTLYHRNVKRPMQKLSINIEKNRRMREPETFEQAQHFHMFSFDNNEMSDNPYSKIPLLSREEKARHCREKIRDIKHRVASYYIFTEGRIKPFDLYELEIYTRELKKYKDVKADTQQIV